MIGQSRGRGGAHLQSQHKALKPCLILGGEKEGGNHPGEARVSQWTAGQGRCWKQESSCRSPLLWQPVASRTRAGVRSRSQKSRETETQEMPRSIPPLRDRLSKPACLQTHPPCCSHAPQRHRCPGQSHPCNSLHLGRVCERDASPVPVQPKARTPRLGHGEQITRAPCSGSGCLTATRFLPRVCEMGWQERGNLRQREPIFVRHKDEILFFGKSEFSLIPPAGGSPFSRGIWPLSQCAKPLWVSTSRVSFSQDQPPNMQYGPLSKYSMSTAQAT